jgi:hypothetical protein
MSKLWDELVNTAIEMDDQLGELNIPDAMGCTRQVTIDGKNYTIKVTIDRDDE